MNALLYGINDLADQQTDLGNDRKGNWIFGPKGWSQQRIRQCLWWSSLLTLAPLVWWGLQEGNPGKYVLWFVAGVGINVLYNSGIVPAPWELPLVYCGFGMVTLLSYWRNTTTNDAVSSLSSSSWHGYYSDPHHSHTNNTSDSIHSSWYLAGCNDSYWIHLCFLIVRSQLWTEYMDYESDRKAGKRTTLTSLSLKSLARDLVTTILCGELLWTYRRYTQQPHLWDTLLTFSVFGLLLFVVLEYRSNSNNSVGTATSISTEKIRVKPDLRVLAAMQNAGGLYLLYDCFKKGVFVR